MKQFFVTHQVIQRVVFVLVAGILGLGLTLSLHSSSFAAKDPGEAAQDLSKALVVREFPDQGKLHEVLQLGLAAKHQEALAAGEAYIQKHKEHPCGHFAMGLVHEWIIEPQIPEPYLGPAIEAFENAGKLSTHAETSGQSYDASAGACRGAALMRLARIYYKYGDTVLGVRRGIAGGRELERAVKMAPDLYDLYAFLGPYHYFIERAPRPAQWVMRLFGLKGDRKLGLEELNTAWQKGSLFKDEAGHILYVVMTDYEGEWEEARNILNNLLTRYPENLVFQRLEAKAAQQSVRSAQKMAP